jgi:hypothetical protein
MPSPYICNICNHSLSAHSQKKGCQALNCKCTGYPLSHVITPIPPLSPEDSREAKLKLIEPHLRELLVKDNILDVLDYCRMCWDHGYLYHLTVSEYTRRGRPPKHAR